MKRPKKIALLGFDCAITPLVERHIKEGICPNFKKVFENGTVAENCLAPFPTITPPNWTVMATGAWPGTNNITDFTRHIPGTTPEGYNTHNCFNWDHVESESFWEAAEKVGKKSIIVNYPMGFNAHKRLKNSIVLGGAALTPGVFMDNEWISREMNIERSPHIGAKFAFCLDSLITTENLSTYATKVEYDKAKGWSNVDDMGDDPLDATFDMNFTDSLFAVKPTKWHILVRDMGNGYDTLTLSPTKNYKDAFFTIKTGEWSKAFDADGLLADGGVKKIRLMSKLVSLDPDDASKLKLYISHGLNTDGEYWIYPKEKAVGLNQGNNICTNNTGMMFLSLGWFDVDTWLEIIGIHYDWLGDTITKLLKNNEWDIFYSHAHPTDYIYHVLITELDSTTCSSKEMFQKAWQLHAELYKHADRYLGRLLELFDEDTMVTLISDHGATPDGPLLDMYGIMEAGGFCYQKSMENPEWLASLPKGVRNNFARRGVQVDASRSKAIPLRSCFVNVNLKGRDPEGIVDPADYKKVQREICDYLLSYVDPRTKTRPFSLALPKEEAKMMGLWGEQCGDVVYAVYPEFASQHGCILPSTSIGEVGEMRPLCVFYGAGVKKGYRMKRVCNLVDLVPTYCYMTGWPVPETAEGAVIYQMLD